MKKTINLENADYEETEVKELEIPDDVVLDADVKPENLGQLYNKTINNGKT